MFVDKSTLERSLQSLYGSASYMLRIWLVLKHMGLSIDNPPVRLNTSNSTESLKRLFFCGSPDGDFYIPFSHTTRYLKMKHDASRSIIQTNVQRWATSGSLIGSDPTSFLDMASKPSGEIFIKPKRNYPLGLGYGTSGFALEEEGRVEVPITAFAVWFGKKTMIPEGTDPKTFLIDNMLQELNISSDEKKLVFKQDKLDIGLSTNVLSDEDIYEECSLYLNKKKKVEVSVHREEFKDYTRKVRSMVSRLDKPSWMRTSPKVELESLLEDGSKAILLYGAPRTGKTRLIDSIVPRNSESRCTIQIHDGWTYDNLVHGLRPDDSGNWDWTPGPLLKAIRDDKKCVVLEEINRTNISQALGEVFSLLEESYRGEENAITLRNGEKFYIPSDVTFLMTMNNIDKSTEDIDDALMGRIASVEVPPRVEDLAEMLGAYDIETEILEKLLQLFSEIQNVYPLGHGYFSGINNFSSSAKIIRYYKVRIRPVLVNFLGELQKSEIDKIDNIVDEMFGDL
ncbi:AAA family ATPase [Vibrio parahaemolyticus]